MLVLCLVIHGFEQVGGNPHDRGVRGLVAIRILVSSMECMVQAEYSYGLKTSLWRIVLESNHNT